MLNWLRTHIFASVILLVLRLYLGYEWMIHGWEKIGHFKTGQFLKGIAANPVKMPDGTEAYPLYTAFIEKFAVPNAALFDILVPWGEFLIGLGLLLGVLTTAASFFGLLMNYMFFLGGFVSNNPTFILLGTIILVAGFNSGRFGGDYWVIPWIRKTIFKKEEQSNKAAAA